MNYYILYYDVPNYFSKELFEELYKNEYINSKSANIYIFYGNNKHLLNDDYFKKYYKIFDLYNETSYLRFNPNSQIKNTSDLNSYYKTLQTELETNNINNDYYRIHFNIPEYFDDVIYKTSICIGKYR